MSLTTAKPIGDLMLRHVLRFLVCILAAMILPYSSAQQVRLRVAPGPYYVDQPITLQLQVGDVDEQPQPQVQLPNDLDENLQLTLVGVAPQTSSSTIIINGRVTRTRSVRFDYTYRLVSRRPGEFTIGSFKVQQGDKQAATRPGVIEFEEIPLDENMRVEFDVPDRSYYLGERIPATIRWSYTGDLQKVHRPIVRVPMLDQFDAEAVTRENQQGTIILGTSSGEEPLPATVRSHGVSSNETIQFEAPLEVIANQVGDFEFAPPSATVQVVTKWSRDLIGDMFPGMGRMGSRRAAASKTVRAIGQPLAVTIKPLPMEGRPGSFAGAVGEEYGIEVEANRTVVRVGDPIALTVTLLGDGYLKTAQLPDFSADGGMSPDKFRLPAEQPSGVFREGRRQFDVNVRVMDESVTEIPPIAYSWFNPVTERYQTARSSPIALRVLPAQVIDANDVVSNHDRDPADGGEADADRAQDSLAAGPAPSVAGFDLSIEQDVERLTAGASTSAIWPMIVPYTIGLLAVVWALTDRRRKLASSRGSSRRRELNNQLRRIKDATALTEVAEALRAMLPYAPAGRREAVERVIAECEAIIFAPRAAATSNDALTKAAVRVAEEIAEEASQGQPTA